ncbi:hypothetical protein MesoLj113a_32420 [Mesorhizobium sp. 113-1-2]|nr:inosine-uridine preferring nucleoside hydrolase [Mesorhizobium loti]BCG72084.1 hypothetical protein MesoLj113a_32420 [Mesorhizobium sp. 113-1-2]
MPVGPYTNIALAVRKDPRIVERVKKVVALGGSYTRGNITPAAEFNVYGDPEAADVVFRANWDVTMVGLDLTHQTLATPRPAGPGARHSAARWPSSSSISGSS